MQNLKIKGVQDEFYIPEVNFDFNTGICEISGESYLEETLEFYEPLIDWLNQYISEIKKPIEFNFKLSYYNTSSSKKILDILRVLKDYEKIGQKVDVNWFFEENDIDTIEDIEDFMMITGLKINLIQYEQ